MAIMPHSLNFLSGNNALQQPFVKFLVLITPMHLAPPIKLGLHAFHHELGRNPVFQLKPELPVLVSRPPSVHTRPFHLSRVINPGLLQLPQHVTNKHFFLNWCTMLILVSKKTWKQDLVPSRHALLERTAGKTRRHLRPGYSGRGHEAVSRITNCYAQCPVLALSKSLRLLRVSFAQLAVLVSHSVGIHSELEPDRRPTWLLHRRRLSQQNLAFLRSPLVLAP
mmetsp:Transcript_15966/g.30036  ORF Transcript_15966/g.30036 Transcript_15966/m.30036 type:complete len:223 (+) Transcript_15966:67-735(+)